MIKKQCSTPRCRSVVERERSYKTVRCFKCRAALVRARQNRVKKGLTDIRFQIEDDRTFGL